MKNLSSLFGFILFIFSNVLYSQGWDEAKCFSYLKGEKEICLKFNYDQLMIEDIWTFKTIWTEGKSSELKTEDDYLKMKLAKYDNKKAGRGELWVQDWEKNKKNRFEPKFEKLFNKGTKHRLLGRRFTDSLKYTILINVKRMRLGMSGGYAICDFEVLIFETAEPSKILCKAIMDEVYGLKYGRQENIAMFYRLSSVIALISGTMPSSYSDRVKDCYAECGKELGKEIRLSCHKNGSSSLRKEPIFID